MPPVKADVCTHAQPIAHEVLCHQAGDDVAGCSGPVVALVYAKPDAAARQQLGAEDEALSDRYPGAGLQQVPGNARQAIPGRHGHFAVKGRQIVRARDGKALPEGCLEPGIAGSSDR